MNRYFPWSRHHGCKDGPILLIPKGKAHGEKNSKNCLENCEKSLKHLSPAAAAQWIK